MSGGHAQSDIYRQIADAVEDARDGMLEPERLEAVRRLLLTDPDARRYYLEINEVSYLLATVSDWLPESVEHPISRKIDERTQRRASSGLGRKRAIAAVAIVAAAIAMIMVVWNRDGDAQRAAPDVIAFLEQTSGEVMIVADGSTRKVGDLTEIKPGDTVKTLGTLSSVVLRYPDNTSFKLVGNSSLTTSGGAQKRVRLHWGTVFGAVTPQPTERPLLVLAPKIEMAVLGTRFSLGATNREIDLSVSEGRVRVTRLDDGQSVEVPAGRRVVSNPSSELKVLGNDGPPAEWNEDLEKGLPEHWEEGERVTTGLPAGSRGGVQSVVVQSKWGDLDTICTQAWWMTGLFAVTEGTHLHVTFKMKNPGFCNILLITKTADQEPPAFAGNYIYDRSDWVGKAPGVWQTATIPLSGFRPLPPSKGGFQGAVPIQVLFSSPSSRHRGLVIDRIWVTKNGLGRVEVERVK